ncbi:MAG: pyruvate kinase [bacterium]
MKRTKIICTLGPASDKVSVLEKMIKAGMNVARLNFSHSTYSQHAVLIKNLRLAAKKQQQNIAIMQDLQGPRIRVGAVPESGIELKKGQAVVLAPEDQIDYKTFLTKRDERIIPLQYDLSKLVKKNDHILINDGLIDIKVQSVKKEMIAGLVMTGEWIFSYKGINLPGIKIATPVITDKDIKDLKFGLKQKVDFLALSFIRDKSDIIALRKLIKKYGTKEDERIKIIAKIERPEAVKNFEAILTEADGVMVARGDLGIELPPQEVPILQKKMIEQCLKSAKPVIVATQMLESMTKNSRPTRAEVSDVANAVTDHTDAVMLSGETATGKHPVETVAMMAKIILETERSPYDDLFYRAPNGKASSLEVTAHMVYAAALDTKSKAIAVITRSGVSPRLISRFRPQVPIIALTDDYLLQRQLSLSWGVYTYQLKIVNNLEKMIPLVHLKLKKEKLVKSGDEIVLVASHPLIQKGRMNFVKTEKIK